MLPKIEDKLTEHSWPKFLHPWPLSEKYFLVACKPDPDALWGIYLVDVFDNMLCLKNLESIIEWRWAVETSCVTDVHITFSISVSCWLMVPLTLSWGWPIN